jgi:hypothetical protein
MPSPEEIAAALLDEKSGVREEVVRSVGTSILGRAYTVFCANDESEPTDRRV